MTSVHPGVMNHPAVSYLDTTDVPTSNLPFSPAITVGETIYVSGQASVDDEGNIVSDTFEGEFRRSIDNMRRILEAAGSDLEHVVQTRNYVRDPADLKQFNELYREYFKAPFPVRTTITNCLPEVLKYEVECVAVKKA